MYVNSAKAQAILAEHQAKMDYYASQKSGDKVLIRKKLAVWLEAGIRRRELPQEPY